MCQLLNESLLQPMRKVFFSVVAVSALFPSVLLADNPSFDSTTNIWFLPMVEVLENIGNEKTCYEV